MDDVPEERGKNKRSSPLLRVRFTCAGLLLIIIATINCKRREPEILEPTFSSISKLILSKKCALHTCHSSAFYKESGDLELMDEDAYFSLVNVKSKMFPDRLRVKAGDPDNSLLINRLEGTVIIAVPLERSIVTRSEISTIRKWIAHGALNN